MTTNNKQFKSWYNKNVVFGWYRTWIVWMAVMAAGLPDFLQIGLENLSLIVDSWVWQLSDTAKSRLQLGMILSIPALRAWKQKSLATPKTLEETPNETCPVRK